MMFCPVSFPPPFLLFSLDLVLSLCLTFWICPSDFVVHVFILIVFFIVLDFLPTPFMFFPDFIFWTFISFLNYWSLMVIGVSFLFGLLLSDIVSFVWQAFQQSQRSRAFGEPLFLATHFFWLYAPRQMSSHPSHQLAGFQSSESSLVGFVWAPHLQNPTRPPPLVAYGWSVSMDQRACVPCAQCNVHSQLRCVLMSCGDVVMSTWRLQLQWLFRWTRRWHLAEQSTVQNLGDLEVSQRFGADDRVFLTRVSKR